MCEAFNYGDRYYLTTMQLAELFEVNQKIINKNFQRNSDKYEEGRHYIVLKKEELKRFKKIHEQEELMKYVSIVYLWTKEGSTLLAKSCEASSAWELLDFKLEEIFNGGKLNG